MQIQWRHAAISENHHVFSQQCCRTFSVCGRKYRIRTHQRKNADLETSGCLVSQISYTRQVTRQEPL